jgi:hypothetical protein
MNPRHRPTVKDYCTQQHTPITKERNVYFVIYGPRVRGQLKLCAPLPEAGWIKRTERPRPFSVCRHGMTTAPVLKQPKARNSALQAQIASAVSQYPPCANCSGRKAAPSVFRWSREFPVNTGGPSARFGDSVVTKWRPNSYSCGQTHARLKMCDPAVDAGFAHSANSSQTLLFSPRPAFTAVIRVRIPLGTPSSLVFDLYFHGCAPLWNRSVARSAS